MKILKVIQQNKIDYCNVKAVYCAMLRPILRGLLYSLKNEKVRTRGSYEDYTLTLLSYDYKHGEGKCGICFEHAIHEAIQGRSNLIMERIIDTLNMCGIPGQEPESVLFGLEKEGNLHIIDKAKKVLTPESKLFIGDGTPYIALYDMLDKLHKAFKNKGINHDLSNYISDLWRADLFIGNTDLDIWVAASVRLNGKSIPRYAEAGLKVYITDMSSPYKNKQPYINKYGQVICPLPHIGGFMGYFYDTWNIVKNFLMCGAKKPNPRMFPHENQLFVSYLLYEHRNKPLLCFIDEELPSIAQPGLFIVKEKEVTTTSKIIIPNAQLLENPQTIITPYIH